MSWFLMHKKGEEKKKRDEIRRQFQKAIGESATDGKLSKDQWLNVMMAAGFTHSVEQMEKMFEDKDKDFDGRLSFEEFMGEETKAERLFKLMDKDGDGFVTKSEFGGVCKNLKKEQIDVAFKKFDQTGNDKLNIKEFSDMMNRRSSSVKTKSIDLSRLQLKHQHSEDRTSSVSRGHSLISPRTASPLPSSLAHAAALSTASGSLTANATIDSSDGFMYPPPPPIPTDESNSTTPSPSKDQTPSPAGPKTPVGTSTPTPTDENKEDISSKDSVKSPLAVEESSKSDSESCENENSTKSS